MSTPGPLFIFTPNLGTRATMYDQVCSGLAKQLQRRVARSVGAGEGKRKQKRKTQSMRKTASGVETTDE